MAPGPERAPWRAFCRKTPGPPQAAALSATMTPSSEKDGLTALARMSWAARKLACSRGAILSRRLSMLKASRCSVPTDGVVPPVSAQ